MTDSLDIALGGPTKKILLNDQEVTLAPMKMRQLAAFAKAVQPIKEELGSIISDLTFANLADVLAKSDDLFKALEVATGIKREVLESLDLAQFIELAGAALAVNSDFFVQKVAPALKETMTGST